MNYSKLAAILQLVILPSALMLGILLLVVTMMLTGCTITHTATVRPAAIGEDGQLFRQEEHNGRPYEIGVCPTCGVGNKDLVRAYFMGRSSNP